MTFSLDSKLKIDVTFFKTKDNKVWSKRKVFENFLCREKPCSAVEFINYNKL